jgi:hypothetical protein
MPESPRLSLWHNGSFLLFLGSSSISVLGSRLTAIAYPLLVLFLHGSPMVVGLAVFAANAPSILLYIPAGALVDRCLDPRRTLLVAEALRGIAIGVIVSLLLVHRATIPVIIGVAVFEESTEVFATLAERSYVRVLVADQASSAQVGIEARAHVVVLVGRVLGSFLFGITPVLPFFADMMSFVLSVASLLNIRSMPATIQQESRENRPSLLREIAGGVRALSGDAFARNALLTSVAMTLVTQALIVVFLMAANVMKVPSGYIGSVLAASGIGGVLGALAARDLRWTGNRSPLKLQSVIWSVALAALAIMGGPGRLPVMAFALAVFGFVGAMANVELDTYFLRTVAASSLARVTSIGMLLEFAACAFGPALGGLLTEMCGMQCTMWLLCGLTGATAVLGRRIQVPVMMIPVPIVMSVDIVSDGSAVTEAVEARSGRVGRVLAAHVRRQRLRSRQQPLPRRPPARSGSPRPCYARTRGAPSASSGTAATPARLQSHTGQHRSPRRPQSAGPAPHGALRVRRPFPPRCCAGSGRASAGTVAHPAPNARRVTEIRDRPSGTVGARPSRRPMVRPVFHRTGAALRAPPPAAAECEESRGVHNLPGPKSVARPASRSAAACS